MLYLLFQLGENRYALEAKHVVEVVPLLTLKKIPQSPKGVAGMIIYRGRAVAALDLSAMTYGRPARELLSTRIIIIESDEGRVARDSPREIESATSAARAAGVISQGETGEVPPGTRPATPVTPLIGLIAERATEMIRRDAKDFVDAGIWPSPPSTPLSVGSGGAGGGLEGGEGHKTRPAAAPFLGPVLVDERGVIQLLHAHKLLAEHERELVFSPREIESATSAEPAAEVISSTLQQLVADGRANPTRKQSSHEARAKSRKQKAQSREHGACEKQ